MKRLKIIVFFIVLVFISCGREIVLRKELIENPPFKKINKGTYKVNLYRLEYPKNLSEKQKFYQEFTDLFRRYYLEDRKITIIIDEQYYNDNIFLKEYQLLEEEMILNKVASTLDEYEIESLRTLVPLKIEKFKNTTQEYLNLQIAYLMKNFEEFENFNPDYSYTEREKNSYINRLREIRKENLKLIEKISVDIILEIENPYSIERDFKNNYWNENNINLSSMSPFRTNINGYNYPLYIKNIKDIEFEKLLKREIVIYNEVLILENFKYEGYIHNNGNFIFFVGGLDKRHQYKDYFVELEIIDVLMEDLVNIKEDFLLRDFVKGGE